jgi:hypothetical protein
VNTPIGPKTPKKHQNNYTSDNYIKFEDHHVDEIKDLQDNHDQNTCKKKK